MNYWDFGTMNNIRDDVTMNINHKLECSKKTKKVSLWRVEATIVHWCLDLILLFFGDSRLKR